MVGDWFDQNICMYEILIENKDSGWPEEKLVKTQKVIQKYQEVPKTGQKHSVPLSYSYK